MPDGRCQREIGCGAAPCPAPRAFLLLTGGQDGHVRVWRPCARRQLLGDLPLHAAAGGACRGAVAAIACPAAPCEAAPFCLSAGADGALAVLEARGGGLRLRHLLSRCGGGGAAARAAARAPARAPAAPPPPGQLIYSLALHGCLALAGHGDGALLCWDARAGAPLWALGANAAALRTISICAAAEALLLAGDDGKAIILDMAR